jgi:transcriptional regulator with GAF, ATPase, and Fis domain
MKIWHHFFGQVDLSFKTETLKVLGHVGVETTEISTNLCQGSGLIFFNEINQPLCDFLCKISYHGIKRVLGIAATRAIISSDGAWRLLQAGASDVFAWDHSDNPAAEVAARLERWDSVDSLMESSPVRSSLIGQSHTWISVLRQFIEVAKFTDASILITGESGTGKELLARMFHTMDPRSPKRDLVVLDCTTIVPELSGSEFFGHERGAFTGAVAPRDGVFALADGGTLFLDEIGELPAGLQAQLLRVVQERTYKRVGGNSWQRTEFRLVCATNRDLEQAVRQGEFRHDLYYRIASFVCKLPPLRERPEDILLLVRHFLREFRSHEGPLELDEPVREYFLSRQYPGNIRDLKQVVSRICCRHVGPGPITAGDIPEEERASIVFEHQSWLDEAFERAIRQALALGAGLKEIGRTAENLAVRIAVAEEDGNMQRAARRLGVTDRALQMRRAASRSN